MLVSSDFLVSKPTAVISELVSEQILAVGDLKIVELRYNQVTLNTLFLTS